MGKALNNIFGFLQLSKDSINLDVDPNLKYKKENPVGPHRPHEEERNYYNYSKNSLKHDRFFCESKDQFTTYL